MEEGNRQKKFSKVILKELSEIFQREYKVPGSMMTTVSVVRTPPDLGMCKVYVSILPDSALKAGVAHLNEFSWEVRQLLAQRIRNQVRHIPELHFYADDTAQYADNIGRLLNEINQNKKE